MDKPVIDSDLRDAILDPNAQVVARYPAIMPTYRGLVDEAAAMALVAYLRSLPKGARP